MSGHSKWATTKHKKAVIDAKRGKIFAKLIKNIEVAARTGGGDPAGNPTLYDAIQKAKKSSVPNDNIDRAVKRGSGLEAGGADWQTIMYEGYGPSGVALLIECLTDNRNRAATEVRTALTRNGGTFADAGSVSYLFNRKGVVIVPKAGLSEDDLLLGLCVAENGVEDGGFPKIGGQPRVGNGDHAKAGVLDLGPHDGRDKFAYALGVATHPCRVGHLPHLPQFRPTERADKFEITQSFFSHARRGRDRSLPRAPLRADPPSA